MNSEKKPSSSCEKAGCICDKAQYNEAQLWEKLMLRFHLLICSRCRKYTEKNKKLTSLLKNADLYSLNEQEEKELKTKFFSQFQQSNYNNQ
ncbi:hypothetical protein [Mesonia maritima]|uniref:Glycine dehydrogenase n=1 Tax=Mesonia maritima TaxID=1793873 RepID=A0ABU1K8N2_9FLAO|nr:hypothetical protein [Mesonia maritima]MDR6301958.1 hypothetical protein [Mesonia maritima]